MLKKISRRLFSAVAISAIAAHAVAWTHGNGSGTQVVGDYDGGVVQVSLSSVTNPNSSTPAIALVMRLAAVLEAGTVGIARGGYWNWDVKVTNVLSKTPTFSVAINDGVHSLSNMWVSSGGVSLPQGAWFSYDQITWSKLANFSVTGTGTTNWFVQFSHNAPFSSNEVYLRSMPGHNVARVTARTAALNGNPLVSHTASWDGGSTSGALQFKIGATTSFSDELGRVIAAQPIYAFKISSGGGNAPDGNPKRKCVFFSGTHPTEQDSQWILWGIIDTLLSGSALASSFLARFDCYIYPCTNPAGIYAGYWRQDPHAPTLDCNRHWLPTNDATVEFCNIIRPAVVADTGGACSVFMDYHAIFSGGIGYFIPTADAAGIGAAYKSALATALTAVGLSSSIAEYGDASPANSSMNWGKSVMTATLSVSPETGTATVTATSQYTTVGVAYCMALVSMFDDGKFPP